MQAAWHHDNYAISGIAAHPCKKRKDGAPAFRYGKGKTKAGRVGQPANRDLTTTIKGNAWELV